MCPWGLFVYSRSTLGTPGLLSTVPSDLTPFVLPLWFGFTKGNLFNRRRWMSSYKGRYVGPRTTGDGSERWSRHCKLVYRSVGYVRLSTVAETLSLISCVSKHWDVGTRTVKGLTSLGPGEFRPRARWWWREEARHDLCTMTSDSIAGRHCRKGKILSHRVLPVPTDIVLTHTKL